MTPSALITEIESCSPARLRKALEWVQAHPEALPGGLPMQLNRHVSGALSCLEYADRAAKDYAWAEESYNAAQMRGDVGWAATWRSTMRVAGSDTDYQLTRARSECLRAVALLREWQGREAA